MLLVNGEELLPGMSRLITRQGPTAISGSVAEGYRLRGEGCDEGMWLFHERAHRYQHDDWRLKREE